MSSTAHHPAFELLRSETIAALNITVEEYKHKTIGTLHYHMSANNPENVFLVALRTVPMDHKGVAHILEHTALCGSKRFPVRDPFFMMIRRSLNTFMNAFTSNDWTAYPFASQNRKDFNNLLDVYLDAVFFSRLDELDFMQEGHRLEFSEPENKNSDLEFKGVVFNEMKGAMSSVSSTLWQTLCKHLFPSTTYHYNSGGDPEYITDLSYNELISFYKQHYHPSNAIFMTYGDMPALAHQQVFEDKVFSQFKVDDTVISIKDEKRYHSPINVEEHYAFDSADSTDNQTHIVLGWLLGQNTELKDMLTSQLINYVLLENSASPLQHYLETTELGTAPSPLCGLEDSYHELVFSCGIAGSEAQHAQQFEQDVLGIIQKIADEGIPLQRLEAIVHQLELSQREITGDSYPYGLQLILTVLPSVTHRGDPISLLDLEPVLVELRESIKDPEYIKTLMRDLLLNNQHRVRLVMTPDTELSKRVQQAEKEKLTKIKSLLTDQQAEDIITKTKALTARQKKIDDPDILPKVGLDDVPKELIIATGFETSANNIPLHYFNQGTNGLVYQQLIMSIPHLDDELLSYLPLYTQCLTEVGIGDKDFTDVQDWQSEIVGSIHASPSLRGSITDEQQVIGYLVISSKALARNQHAMAELLKETLLNARFTESKRIKDIVSQNRNHKENSITGSGHMLAMTAASSQMSPLAKLNENWGGMTGTKTLKKLDDAIKNKDELIKLCNTLKEIHNKVIAMPMQILSVAEKDHQATIKQSLTELWPAANKPSEQLSLNTIRGQNKQAWIANTQVSFCAKAYPTVPTEHEDAAALIVLGGFLRNGYLHTAIREKGGAYGSGAAQDTNIAAFRFYSYRDPRITGTLKDFDAAIIWMLENNHDAAQLEEAILGVVSSLDKPASPAGEAKHAFHNKLFGRTPTQRQAFRQRVLKVTLNDLKRVTQTYLNPEHASIAVISNESNRKELEKLGLEISVL